MKPVKTEMGQRVLKDRSVPLTPRQRSAFILFDGRSTIDQILASTSSMGVTREDVDLLLQLGLLEVSVQPAPAAAPTGPASPPPAAAKSPAGPPAVASDRGPQQRYQDAYPIATKLTASLGLRGFRLNLAVEHAGNYDELCDLAPRIREAVGDKAFADLDRALND